MKKSTFEQFLKNVQHKKISNALTFAGIGDMKKCQRFYLLVFMY